jgi:Tfp pilus assembly protein PilO
MKLSQREKRMLVGGAIIVALVVLVNWIIAPLSRKWAELGRQLAPRLALLETVRSRAERHAVLQARQYELSRQIGSLLDSAQSETPQNKDANTPPAPPATPPALPATPAAPPATPTGPFATPPAPPATPSEQPATAQTPKKELRSFEAELAKTIGQSGAKINLISAKQPPRTPEPLKYFKMTALRVEAEGNADSLVKMLLALEKGNRFIRIDTLKIHQDVKKPGALNLTMEIVAYVPADKV